MNLLGLHSVGQGSRFFLSTAIVLEHILRSSSTVGAQRGLKMQLKACTEEIFWILCWFEHTSYLITPPNTFRHTFRCLQCEPQEKGWERNCITLLHVTVHSFFPAVFLLIQDENRAIRWCVTHKRNSLHCVQNQKVFFCPRNYLWASSFHWKSRGHFYWKHIQK